MREIKFRVFCTYRKTMIQVGVDSNASFNSDGTISTHGILGENPLLQFTGLKDKNGVEIFEGDIVREERGINEVKFEAYDSFQGYFLNTDDWSLEVIGNIYEHPYLLTEH